VGGTIRCVLRIIQHMRTRTHKHTHTHTHTHMPQKNQRPQTKKRRRGGSRRGEEEREGKEEDKIPKKLIAIARSVIAVNIYVCIRGVRMCARVRDALWMWECVGVWVCMVGVGVCVHACSRSLANMLGLVFER